MKRNLLSITMLLLTCTWAGISAPANAKTATFQRSCDNSRVKGDYLIAICSRIDGTPQLTGMNLLGIENDDGNLVDTFSRKNSSFQKSCTNISINGSTLSASCLTRNGKSIATSLTLNGVENRNGRLIYEDR